MKAWQFLAPDGTWLDAAVPGHIHPDLQRHGLIEDPFVLDKERACQWVDDREWSYRHLISYGGGRALSRQLLVFEGLDTVCSVFLNGELLAEHDNMFIPLDLDVTGNLRDGDNEIRVDFRSAAEIGRVRRTKYLASQGLPQDVPNFDERAFVRKAQYMFGWDWGPRLVSCGIWRPAHLIELEPGEVFARAQRIRAARSGRKPKLMQVPDAEGSSFRFEVDGREFYALGANWIPDHSFPGNVTRERLEHRIKQARAMGVNMLRVWGGGIYESDEFYDLCDEHGILVWQDFMFACSYYPDTLEWQEAIEREASYQVERLRHHPCIALWCGNNECHQVWQDGWGGKEKQPPRFHGEALYHETLKRVVERLDPERPYVPGSPFGEGYCNSGASGDQHFWDVWHGRGDWLHYRDSDARFCSEFGFASSPSPATWKRAGVDVSAEVEDPMARAHNKTGKPFELIRNLVELHYPRAGDLNEWFYYSQLNQRDAMREALHHYRFNGRCFGALIWQLNDCWPIESWSILEFDGRKKAIAYELPRLFAPLLLRLRESEGAIRLEACLHNSVAGVAGEAALGCFDLSSGEEISSVRGEANLQPEEVRVLATSDSPTAERACLWVGSFGGATAFHVSAKPHRTDRSPDLFWERTAEGVRVTARQVAIDVYAEDRSNPEVEFEPNFFTLVPGESIELAASGDFDSLRFRCLDY